MQNFCQFEVDFHVINKAVHLKLWIPGEALPTLTLYRPLNYALRYFRDHKKLISCTWHNGT